MTMCSGAGASFGIGFPSPTLYGVEVHLIMPLNVKPNLFGCLVFDGDGDKIMTVQVKTIAGTDSDDNYDSANDDENDCDGDHDDDNDACDDDADDDDGDYAYDADDEFPCQNPNWL